MPSADATAPNVVRLDRDRVAVLMRARGWNIHRLAVVADVPKRQVRRVLFGYGEPTRSVLERLSEAFGVPVEDLTRRP